MSEYEQGQAFGGVIDVLNAIGAQYAIWGGIAVVAYGEPRFTQDMDILLAPAGLVTSMFVRRLRSRSKKAHPLEGWDEWRVRSTIASEYQVQ
jgi:hypothetical protein